VFNYQNRRTFRDFGFCQYNNGTASPPDLDVSPLVNSQQHEEVSQMSNLENCINELLLAFDRQGAPRSANCSATTGPAPLGAH